MDQKRKRQKLASKTDEGDGNNFNDDTDEVPVRSVDNLFASSVTVDCALKHGCVPCAYKLGSYNIALDLVFCKSVPNRRPEECPRANASVDDNKNNAASLGYAPGMNVLTVGDGDFSFSLAIARILYSKQTKKSTGNLVATSYESKETLRRVYQDFENVSSELEALGAKLCYEVDATNLRETLPSTVVNEKFKFHRIVWNFPCSAIEAGQDGQNEEMENNKALVRAFVQNARHFAVRGGEIHMAHKTKPPFNQWRIEEIAVERCKDSQPMVTFAGRVVLDRCLLPPYQPRKALHRKSFPCHDACFYIFSISNSDLEAEKRKVTATIPTGSIEYKVSEVVTSPSLVPLTRDLILSVRERALADAAISKMAKRGTSGKRKRRKTKR